MSPKAPPASRKPAPAAPGALLVVAAIMGWLLPGGGHLALRRLGRGAVGLATIAILFAAGVAFEGEIPRPERGSLLSYGKTFACLGLGPSYFIARGQVRGDSASVTSEYGNTLLYAAGLLNMLLILDAYDIAAGRKS